MLCGIEDTSVTDEEYESEYKWFFPGYGAKVWAETAECGKIGWDRRMADPVRYAAWEAESTRRRPPSKLKPIKWIRTEEYQPKKRRKRRPNKPRVKPINHTLYYCYDAFDVPIYIGISVDAGHRMKQHCGTKDWGPEVVSVDMDHFGSRAELE